MTIQDMIQFNLVVSKEVSIPRIHSLRANGYHVITEAMLKHPNILTKLQGIKEPIFFTVQAVAAILSQQSSVD